MVVRSFSLHRKVAVRTHFWGKTARKPKRPEQDDERAGGRRRPRYLSSCSAFRKRRNKKTHVGAGIRDSRVVCVRNPADCEVKSGALLRWRSPQALLAMSHLRGLGFARDRNHQKRHFRSEVSHLSSELHRVCYRCPAERDEAGMNHTRVPTPPTKAGAAGVRLVIKICIWGV